MPVITIGVYGCCSTACFPVCVGFITFGYVSSKWKSKTIRTPVIFCQLELNPIF